MAASQMMPTVLPLMQFLLKVKAEWKLRSAEAGQPSGMRKNELLLKKIVHEPGYPLESTIYSFLKGRLGAPLTQVAFLLLIFPCCRLFGEFEG